jgi:16S rRNA (guanine966-N2)-methyltransferase
MRIIAGAWRGRQITAPPEGVRPTSDRVREAWMSIVGSEIHEARVLDLFAGAGALGLESLSRGAASAHFVDNAPKSLAAISANAATLGAGERAVIHRADAVSFAKGLQRGQFDIAFADPPYADRLATRIAEAWLARPFAALLGIEHHRDERLPGSEDRRKYGDTVITFYRDETVAGDHAIISAESSDHHEST